MEVNLDQPFDYDSPYYQVHEMEVMAAISSGRMDAVVCGEDLYRYLLALNACCPLDQCLPEDLLETLSSSGKLKTDTAGLPAKQNGATSHRCRKDLPGIMLWICREPGFLSFTAKPPGKMSPSMG